MNQIAVVAPLPTILVKYDEMCRAIAAAYRVDEVKAIRDHARAIEIYAQQALNVEAERQACEIRLRAERRSGVLLKERDKAKGAAEPGTDRGATPSHAASASKPLAELGISHTQSSRWQKLAEVPEDEFEAIITAPGPKPTTAGIIAAHAEPKPKQVDDRALWLWGRLEQIVREGLLAVDPDELMETMLPHMQVTVREQAPLVASWLWRFR